jgi:hypothetical protein
MSTINRIVLFSLLLTLLKAVRVSTFRFVGTGPDQPWYYFKSHIRDRLSLLANTRSCMSNHTYCYLWEASIKISRHFLFFISVDIRWSYPFSTKLQSGNIVTIYVGNRRFLITNTVFQHYSTIAKMTRYTMAQNIPIVCWTISGYNLWISPMVIL